MEGFFAWVTEPMVIVGLLVAFAVVALFTLRKRLTRLALGPSGATVEADSARDLASIRNIKAAGTDIEIAATGKGTSVDGVKIDPNSKNINIKSST
jgi:hypothetical protein